MKLILFVLAEQELTFAAAFSDRHFNGAHFLFLLHFICGYLSMDRG